MISIEPAIQVNWDWRAAGNFICGGTGAGLMAIAACGAWTGMPGLELVALAAVGIVGLGLGLVWLEIGRPWRFLNVLRNPATSWMSREAWAAVGFMPAGVLAALTGSAVVTSIAAAAGLFFLLCQAQMLRAARGIPAWRDAAIVPLVAVTGLTEGVGLMIAAAAFTHHQPQWLSITALIMVLWRTVLVLVYGARLRRRKAPDAVVNRLKPMTMSAAVVGGVIPALLLVGAIPLGVETASALAGLIAAATGWHLKYTVVRSLAFTQGFAIERSPARGAATAGPGTRPGWSR